MTIAYMEGKKMTILFSDIVALTSDFLILFMLHKSINLEIVKHILIFILYTYYTYESCVYNIVFLLSYIY